MMSTLSSLAEPEVVVTTTRPLTTMLVHDFLWFSVVSCVLMQADGHPICDILIQTIHRTML